ncbi:isoleucyl-tRNA synthetase [Bacillus horti]|uniref:Isoleucine--tRNA ligase n=1 Tax=Caldalkalibacillus horti TaxID=77523 RepID=A0ABT9W3D2_9BACI|nr:isoleucine--tRNA ligase [Bacillus horti]MDQ0167746.1 isoleucyl-tRNA synthetase [Bacillus horti]
MRKVDTKETAHAREQRVLAGWREQETFKKSVEQREGQPSFVFYEGPPTANGLPHAGHVLGRVIKDFIARYKTMTGYQVVRKAGWDTHGLPVELGVEKQLGISGKKEIEEYGVEQFIEKCKESVFQYEKQWRDFSEEIGYWLDFDDPYVTLQNEYIESVWHILSHIHRKGLLYKGHRVTPYCPSCQTSLSTHEVAQGYKDVKDLSATVKFTSKASGEHFLVWTTTPWTLPANVTLAVHPDLTYCRVKQGKDVYILAKNLVDKVLQGDFELLSEHLGSEFVGVDYTAPFSFIAVEKGHRVVAADFVTESSGTGIVHLAPAFGDDDYQVIKKLGLSYVNPVDTAGRYKAEVTSLAGRFVKDCDVDIVKDLAGRGLLYTKEKYEHSYPFCWRCDSPLLYYAMESWFIQTTAVKEQLIANNQQVTWYPEHIKDGRFGRFLEDLMDWNISRSRYWGTPLNVWECTSCEQQYAPSGLDDLRSHATKPLTDIELHKPYIDQVDLNCPSCQGIMKRTPEVIDVWFDSGSMPFAQYHYPFAEGDRFKQQFPADMICEGIDQTRGWFYSLLAVSTLYTGQAPYKSVMSLGHILDENGQKMSKSKGNVLHPSELVQEFGADALRWALLSDSAPWNSKRFSKKIVAEAKSKVIDTLMNVHSFYTLYATIDGYDPQAHFNEQAHRLTVHTEGNKSSEHEHVQVMDQWLKSRLHSTVKAVHQVLEHYDFMNASRAIEDFVEQLSNWYIRRSRDRFWSEGLSSDKRAAYGTLHQVLVTLSQLVAPFIPFLAEDMYGNLTGESVHLTEFPEPDESLINEQLEKEMENVLQIVELARSVRNTSSMKTKQPLSELVLVPLEDTADVSRFYDIIKDEVNVKSIVQQQDETGLLEYALKLNFKQAGPKYGKSVGELQTFITQLSAEQAKQAVDEGGLAVQLEEGQSVYVDLEDMLVEKKATRKYASATGKQYTVALNTTLTKELVQEGIVREISRAVQEYRKKLNLSVEQRIHLILDVDAETKEALQEFNDLLQRSLLLSDLNFSKVEDMEYVTIGDKQVGMAIQ